MYHRGTQTQKSTRSQLVFQRIFRPFSEKCGKQVVACLFLETLGFINTKNMEGGLITWQEKFSDQH